MEDRPIPQLVQPRPLPPEVPIDGAACRAARSLLELTQTQLCVAADVGRKLIIDFEDESRNPRFSNVAAIRAALEARGIVFWDCGHGIGVSRDRTVGERRTARALSLRRD